MKRSVGAIVLSVALAITMATMAVPGTAGASTPARGGPAAPPVPTIPWASCNHTGVPQAECATATVPLDYDDPTGTTTGIALVRIPATDAANRVGSLFVNPGGPGSSGVGYVLGGTGEYLHAKLGGRFDVIGFDPRGVARSDPLSCFPSNAERSAFLLAAHPRFPYLDSQYRPFFDNRQQYAARCLGQNDPIAQHMSTADVARDLDVLRQAVGDRQLTYLGLSYGSYIGTTYANLFENNIRSMALDGVLDPILWSTGLQITSDRVAIELVFDEFLRLCDEAGPACAFHTAEGAKARWERLIAALKAGPVVRPPVTYRYDLVLVSATNAMRDPRDWPDFAEFLDPVADAVLQDDPAGAAAQAAALEEAVPRGQPIPGYNNMGDALYGNMCADIEYPRTFAAFVALDRYAAAGSEFGPYPWWSNAPCATWPVNEDRYTGPWLTRTSAPVLVVGNKYDPVTDLAGARAVSRLLIGSRLLTYEGWGHTALPQSQCAIEHVIAYLGDQVLPPRGAVCPAPPSPFGAIVARSAEVHSGIVAPTPSWQLDPAGE